MTDAEFAAFLKDISICFETGDFALWKSRVILPFSLVTKDGPVTILTEEELEENFRAYIQAGEIMGLEEVIRKPMSIEDCKDGTFIATYRTDLMGQGRHQADPYTSSALIRQIGGTWRMSSILNARGHHEWTGRHPLAKGD